MNTSVTAIHGRDHLHVVDDVQIHAQILKFARQTGFDNIDHQFTGAGGIFSTEEVKIVAAVVHVRGFTVIDAVRVDDNVAGFPLPEDDIQPRDMRQTAVDHIAQCIPRADARKLIDIAYQQQMTFRFQRFQQAVEQQQVDHRRFIDDHEIDIQRVVFIG